MNNYISKLSDKNIKKILDLRDMCLDIRQRDFFYKKVRDFKLALFNMMKSSYSLEVFVLSLEFPKIVDYIYIYIVLNRTSYQTINDIEEYGVKFEDLFDDKYFDLL